MKNLFEKLKVSILGPFETTLPAHFSAIRIIKSRKLIRKELTESRDTGKVVGIYCPPLGEGMFLTAVDEIINIENEEIVVVKPYDMNGILLQRNHISITEIRSVCPFDTFYINPMIKNEKELLFK